MSGGRHHQLAKWRNAWSALTGIGRLALLLTIVAALVVLVSAGGLLPALLAPSAGAASASGVDEKQLAERFSAGFDRSLAQINGRSMFFDPVAPRREPVRVASDETERPPPTPTKYGGPALVGFAHGAAWFAGDKRLREGDESDPKFKLKKISPPWSATVEWEGVEFTVNLFDRDRLINPLSGAGTASSSDTGARATEVTSGDIKKDATGGEAAGKPDAKPAADASGEHVFAKDFVGPTTPDHTPAAEPAATPAASPRKR